MNGCAVCSAVSRNNGDLAARADSRSPRATNAGTRQAIASARISVLPSSSPRSRGLGEHVEDLLDRRDPARPVGAHQDGGQSGAVAQLVAPSRSRSRGRPHHVRARPGSRARAPARRAARLAASSPRRRARPRPPPAARQRPGRPCPVASTPPRSRSPRAPAAARRPARGRSPPPHENASSASTALPPRWLALPRSRKSSARSAGLSMPSSSAVRRRAAASSKASAAVAARAAARCTRLPARRRRRARPRQSGARGRRARGRSETRRPPVPRRPEGEAPRAAPTEPVVQRAPHELVGEVPGQARRRRSPRSSRCGPPRRAPREARVPRRRRHGGRRRARTPHLPWRRARADRCSRRQACEPLAYHLANALRACQLGGRAHHSHLAVGQLDGPGLDERAPELAHQESVAVRQVADRVRPARAGRGRAHRLRRAGRTRATSSPERPASAGERRRSAAGRRASPRASSGTSASVSRKVASSSTRAFPPARARWRRRSSVGASAQWPSSSTSSAGRRRVTPASRSATAVWSRWRSVSGSASTAGGSPATRDARSGSSRVSSPPAGAERRPQLVGLDGSRELVERLDERAVGGGNHRVARAVEHERAVARRLGGELAHEAALARAGLAAEQDDAPALALCTRQQRAQPLQLGRAARRTETPR